MKVWYGDTAKGRAACLMEDDILHRFLLPQTHLDIGQLKAKPHPREFRSWTGG